MKCQYEVCETEVPLPFICEACQGAFCLSHKAPALHQCKGMQDAAEVRPVYSAATINAPVSLPSWWGLVLPIYIAVGLMLLFFYFGTISYFFFFAAVFAPGAFIVAFIASKASRDWRAVTGGKKAMRYVTSKWLLIPLFFTLALMIVDAFEAGPVNAAPGFLIAALPWFSLTLTAPFTLALVLSRTADSESEKTRVLKVIGSTALAMIVIVILGIFPLESFAFTSQTLFSTPFWFVEDVWVTATSVLFAASMVSLIHGRWTRCPGCLRWWAVRTNRREPTGEYRSVTTSHGSGESGYETTSTVPILMHYMSCKHCDYSWTVKR